MEEWEDFWKLMLQLEGRQKDKSRPRISFLLTSSPQLGMGVKNPVGFEMLHIDMSPQKTEEDIRQYIELKAKDLANLDERENLRSEIATKLMERAKGFFLWVDLTIKLISKEGQDGDIEDILLSSPIGHVDDVLQKIVQALLDYFKDVPSQPGDFNVSFPVLHTR
jgi:hypothetical protein